MICFAIGRDAVIITCYIFRLYCPWLMTYHPERFQIHSPSEIACMLRSMQDKAERLRMRFADSAETVITCVLGVDLKNGCVFLDCAASPAQNRLALQSRGISFEAVINRVRIAFRANRLRQASFNGRPALVMELPESIVRYQRRESVRHALDHALIRIPAGSEREITANVRDISVGGMTLIDEAGAISYGVNALYQGCELRLPETRPVMVNIRFRNMMMVLGKRGGPVSRIGCQFADLDDAEAVKIRRFVADVERQHRMRADSEEG
ncbi:MAG: flagellar brake protein [Oxalobacter sp.]|nr:flagellar brake protein [Oxalobacter sp.]